METIVIHGLSVMVDLSVAMDLPAKIFFQRILLSILFAPLKFNRNMKSKNGIFSGK